MGYNHDAPFTSKYKVLNKIESDIPPNASCTIFIK